MAWTGIASVLLPRGMATHRTFKLKNYNASTVNSGLSLGILMDRNVREPKLALCCLRITQYLVSACRHKQ